MKSTIYTVDGREFELKHFGVKGMKWGRRKARPEAAGSGRSEQTDNSHEAQAARKEARRQKAKRAAKIGAAVVAAGLAVYGAKKLDDVVKSKAHAKALARGQAAVKLYMNKHGESDYTKHMRRATYSYAANASRRTTSAVKELLRKDRNAGSVLRDLDKISTGIYKNKWGNW